MKTIKDTLLYLWQLPQHLLALVIWGILQPMIYDGGTYLGKKVLISKAFLSSFSLGNYLFFLPKVKGRVIGHELGHSVQSQYLGWLYLPIIAVPSVLHNIYRMIKFKLFRPKTIEEVQQFRKDYYKFYTERWAEKLSTKFKFK